jgi:hypothetical protein
MPPLPDFIRLFKELTYAFYHVLDISLADHVSNLLVLYQIKYPYMLRDICTEKLH